MHYVCLKSWVDSKRKIKNYPHVTTYYWKDLTCELCKVQLPEAITVQGKEISCKFIFQNQNRNKILNFYLGNKLLDYQVPKGAKYCVLETYSHSDERSRIIHVLDFGLTPTLTVGRCRESNLKIPDNSVSRLHSEIISYGSKFYHMDLQSKFGTLRIFRKPLKITSSLIIQSG